MAGVRRSRSAAGRNPGRAIGDASGDFPNTSRSAFPKDTPTFRAAFGDAFADMLIAEANASRALRNMGPKTWVYKGYGIFQYDLQHVHADKAFFRERSGISSTRASSAS